MNRYTGRSLAASLDGRSLGCWEEGLVDFLSSYRGYRHASTGRSSYELVMGRLMRLPWKFQALLRHVLPDLSSPEEMKKHMVCLLASLAALQGEAQESALKRQVRNLKEYNQWKKVPNNAGHEVFFLGDMVWVRAGGNRRN